MAINNPIQFVNPWTGQWVDIDPEDVTQARLDQVAGRVPVDVRERLHMQMAPCEPPEFLRALVNELGPDEVGRLWLGG